MNAGQKRFKLTLISLVNGLWTVLCDCGVQRTYTPKQLVCARTCGCVNKEKQRARVRAYNARMKKRREALSLGDETPRFTPRSHRLCRRCKKALPLTRYFHHEGCAPKVDFFDMADCYSYYGAAA